MPRKLRTVRSVRRRVARCCLCSCFVLGLVLTFGAKLREVSSRLDWRYALRSFASEQDSAQALQLSLERRRLLEAAVAKPVDVVVLTGHFFGRDFLRQYQNCTVPGTDLEIECHWKQHSTEKQEDGNVTSNADTADVIAYHGPGSCTVRPQRRWSGQLAMMFSMESPAYYPCQGNASWLKTFDVTMTTSLNSTFPLPYLDKKVMRQWQAEPTVPTDQKHDALVFLNSNCGDQSGRTGAVQAIIDLGLVPVHAFGGCLRNQNFTGRIDSKNDLFRNYKFCIAMENSIEEHYVTEKVYDGLIAGCLPVYLGTPDIVPFLPHPDAALVYRNPQQISDEMLRLMNDTAEYEHRVLSWRQKPLEELPDSLQRLIGMRAPDVAECKLCQHVVQHRVAMAESDGS